MSDEELQAAEEAGIVKDPAWKLAIQHNSAVQAFVMDHVPPLELEFSDDGVDIADVAGYDADRLYNLLYVIGAAHGRPVTRLNRPGGGMSVRFS